MKRTVFLVFTVIFCMLSCGETYDLFCTRYPVRFSFSTSVVPYNQVTSLGAFVSVRRSGASVLATTQTGSVYTLPMSQMESESFLLGLSGLIIGTPSLGNDNCSVWAYDLGCPICDKAKYRLSINTSGVARCDNCASTFDLNNNGYVIASESENARPLYRYPVTSNGITIVVAN